MVGVRAGCDPTDTPGSELIKYSPCRVEQVFCAGAMPEPFALPAELSALLSCPLVLGVAWLAAMSRQLSLKRRGRGCRPWDGAGGAATMERFCPSGRLIWGWLRSGTAAS